MGPTIEVQCETVSSLFSTVCTLETFWCKTLIEKVARSSRFPMWNWQRCSANVKCYFYTCCFRRTWCENMWHVNTGSGFHSKGVTTSACTQRNGATKLQMKYNHRANCRVHCRNICSGLGLSWSRPWFYSDWKLSKTWCHLVVFLFDWNALAILILSPRALSWICPCPGVEFHSTHPFTLHAQRSFMRKSACKKKRGHWGHDLNAVVL